MKKMIAYLLLAVSVCVFSSCATYVDIDKNKDTEPDNPKEEIVTQEQKEQPINPMIIQKVSVDEARKKAEKTYGGKDVMIRLNGEYEFEGMLYYVFDFGTDIEGMFYKDFSVVVDAQSGEMFEGTYDKKTKKIVRY